MKNKQTQIANHLNYLKSQEHHDGSMKASKTLKNKHLDIINITIKCKKPKISKPRLKMT